jgi:hypothetical protein
LKVCGDETLPKSQRRDVLETHNIPVVSTLSAVRKAGQRIITVAGIPLGTPGATNMVRIAFVGSEAAEED